MQHRPDPTVSLSASMGGTDVDRSDCVDAPSWIANPGVGLQPSSAVYTKRHPASTGHCPRA